MPIPDSELLDAQNAAREYGYDPDTFTFEWVPYPKLTPGPGPYPIIADVVVVNTVSGVSRTYKAGHGSSWPAEFADHVAQGEFGSRR